MKKQNISYNPEEVRESLLEYLFGRYKKARSTKKQSATMSEIKKALKAKNFKETDIVSAITFLKDRGWIKEEREITKFFIKDKLTESEKIKYRISDIGIVHFEGPSKFTAQEKFSGINITNIQGVTILGNNNIVRNEFVDLFRTLEELSEKVRTSNVVDDELKAEIQSDIETIKNQLGKKKPNGNIIKIAWETIKNKLNQFEEFVKPIVTIANLIKIFIE